jgi:hypothetical protein
VGNFTPIPSYLKLSKMSDDPITMQSVLLDIAPVPFTYLNFHEYLTNLELENHSNFLVECLLYKQKAEPFFTDADLCSFPSKPVEMSKNEYDVDLKDLVTRWTRLTEMYIINGAPCQLKMEKEVREVILEHVDLNHFHPDILKTAVELMNNVVKPHFESFLIDSSLQGFKII